ncbi:MAG: TrbG/VirB9 family P-type conjugative transfer protein [Rickettsiales bacterium]
MKRALFYALAGIFALGFTNATHAFEPIVTDSRIKTLVYNENDVYPIVTHYGYQSNIEFSTRESIETISLGDRVGWQIVPAGRRLFIRPLQENGHTNMTIITNKRAYQFDLYSGKGTLKPAEDLAYVVRFYYPDEERGARPMMPASAMPVSASQLTNAAEMARPTVSSLNFRYTFTGPDALAPAKVFDDGRATYFQVRSNPTINVVSANGQETPLQPTMTSDGFLKVPMVAGKFVLRYGKDMICVYNESM